MRIHYVYAQKDAKTIMKKVIFNCLSRNRHTSSIAACLVLHRWTNSYLNTTGWFESFYVKMPIDKNGEAIPWYTYSSISFLEGRIEKNMSVFEYGSGNSTIWWAKRVENIISCENDAQWFAKMNPLIQENVEYIHVDSLATDNYEKEIQKHDKKFDVVIIDGRNRVNCAKNSLDSLKNDGVIIWDNSDREKYQEGYKFLLENGFRRLDFTGIGPINAYAWCTSIFYRVNNCLGI